MKQATTFLVAFICVSVVMAQQEPLSSIFWTNYSVINPANSGVSEKALFNVQGRSQWTQINGHPNTVWTSADYKIDKINSGVGLNYIYDELGLLRCNKIGLNYNYQIEIKKLGLLSLGLSGAYHAYTLRFSQKVWKSNDPVAIDPAIPSDDYKESRTEFGVGLVWYLGGLKLGGSIQSLPKPPADPYLGYWQNTGYVFVESDLNLSEVMTLIPRVMYRRTGTKEPVEATDYHLSLKLFNKFILGGTYRDVDVKTYNLIVGLELKDQLRLNYCYELSDLSEGHSLFETHEFSLSYLIASKEQ